MNVASLELCKELYELTEWGNTYFHHQSTDNVVSTVLRTELAKQKVSAGVAGYAEFTPAYDAGYLLRRLQDTEGLSLHRCHHQDNTSNWGAECDHTEPLRNKVFAYADTPEDALCKLAIELCKQGLLTKEQDNG